MIAIWELNAVITTTGTLVDVPVLRCLHVVALPLYTLQMAVAELIMTTSSQKHRANVSHLIQDSVLSVVLNDVSFLVYILGIQLIRGPCQTLGPEGDAFVVCGMTQWMLKIITKRTYSHHASAAKFVQYLAANSFRILWMRTLLKMLVKGRPIRKVAKGYMLLSGYVVRFSGDLLFNWLSLYPNTDTKETSTVNRSGVSTLSRLFRISLWSAWNHLIDNL
eukprot:PhF_6_TR5393/c0_g1_i1/m.7709/K05479/TNFSF18, GITRL; tumor necrosis factor ligand superfamily member 18